MSELSGIVKSNDNFKTTMLSTWLGARGQRRWNSSLAFIVRRLHPLPARIPCPLRCIPAVLGESHADQSCFSLVSSSAQRLREGLIFIKN